MSDRRLKAFYTVAKLGSFTKAAKVLHLTQPAVTLQVRHLERHYKIRLFDRRHNRVRITEPGLRAYEYAEKIFALYGELDAEMRRVAGDLTGPVTLAASSTIAVYMLPRMLQEFRNTHQEMDLRIKISNTEGVATMVEEDVADLGFVEGPVPNPALSTKVCKVDEMVVVAPPGHPLLEKSSVSARATLQHPFIMREEGSGTREEILNYLHKQGIDHDRMDIVMELDGLEAIKGVVESGIGVSILSRETLYKEQKLGTLESVSLRPALTRKLSLVQVRRGRVPLQWTRCGNSCRNSAPGRDRGGSWKHSGTGTAVRFTPRRRCF